MTRTLAMRDIAFLFLLCFIAAIPMENAIVVDGVGRFSRVVGMATGAFWLFTVVVSGSFRRPRPFHYLVLMFVLWNALSLFWTIDFASTLARVSTWAQLAIMVAIVWDLVTTPRQLHLCYQAFVVGAYVSAFSTIYGYLGGQTYYQHRYAAAGFHPNGLGFILVMAAPIAWYIAMDGSQRQHNLRRLVNLAYLPVAAIAIALTGTRTAIVAAVPVLIYILLGKHSSKQTKTVMMGVGVVVLVVGLTSFVPASSFQRLSTIGTEFTEGDFNGRMRLWLTGLDIFRDHSIVGIGSNAYKTIVGHVAHNAFVSVAVELGAVGFFLFGTVVALVFYRASTLPPRISHFLLALMFTWALGSSALTWEHKKTTWLIMSFVIVSAHISDQNRTMNRATPRPRQLIEYG